MTPEQRSYEEYNLCPGQKCISQNASCHISLGFNHCYLRAAIRTHYTYQHRLRVIRQATEPTNERFELKITRVEGETSYVNISQPKSKNSSHCNSNHIVKFHSLSKSNKKSEVNETEVESLVMKNAGVTERYRRRE